MLGKNKPERIKIRNTWDMRLFNIIGYSLVAVFALACVIPFILVLTGSFTNEKWILTNGYSLILTPKNFSLEGYSTIFKSPEKIINAYMVTTFVTVVGTVLSILLVTMTGYVLSRPSFPWRNGVSFYFFFTTLFSGGLVPYYLLCTQYLHFKNHIYALIIPGIFSVWNMIIAKSFMKGIPNELVESAKIDGAGDLRIYFQIMMPLCKPMIATLALFTALGYWNDWYNCMLFISDDTKYNLQYTLQNMLRSAEFITKIAQEQGRTVASVPSESMKLAMTVVAIGPIIALYPFLQKFFVKGITIGSVKG